MKTDDEMIKTPSKFDENIIIDSSEIINHLAKGCDDCGEELTLT